MSYFALRSRLDAVAATRGASLIVSLMFTLLLITLAAGSFAAVMTLMRVTSQVERANAAYFAAESGVELALYDIAAYGDGYEHTTDDTVCTDEAPPIQTISATQSCSDTYPYRFVDFESRDDLSGSRSFWRLFSRALPEGSASSSGARVVPDPFFVGDKDGTLEPQSGSNTEWGRITKQRPLSLSLMADVVPGQVDPDDQYHYLVPSVMSSAVVTFMVDDADIAAMSSSPSFTDDEPLLLWTLSAIDGTGEEYTLQGVAHESDMATQRDCDSDSVVDDYCIQIDLLRSIAPSSVGVATGDMHAGEDINKNIDANDTLSNVFNRVAGIQHDWHINDPDDFFAAMESANINANLGNAYAPAWRDARLTVSMIGTLSDTSDIASDSLLYRVDVQVDPTIEVADEYTYIVSEGYSGAIKQSIETRFQRQSTIPIFSYAIFQ